MRSLVATFVGMVLFAAVGLLGPRVEPAVASTDVNLTYISTLTARVVVSSGSAVRIDAWNGASSPTVLLDRAGINFQNQDATNAIYCLHSSAVSTDTANANIGFKYTAGTFGS